MRLPCGTFNESYASDMAIVRTRLQWGLLIAFVILLFVSPLFVSEYWLSIVNTIAIYLIAVAGLQILTGYCGQINLGQAAFMAVGAYTSGIMMRTFGLSFWASIPCAAIAAALAGVLFSLPAVRIKGFYLAMTTLAAQFIISWLCIHGGDITRGTFGLLISRPQLGDIVFNTETRWFYLIVPISLIMLLLARNITRTKAGRAFIAIRDNDLAAEIMGISLFKHKMLAFAICSVYAGVAGCLWANYLGIATYEHYSLMNSVWMLGMLIVGGLGSMMGVIYGTIFIRLLFEGVSTAAPAIADAIPAIGGAVFAALGLITVGLVIMLFLIYEPRGLNRRWEIIKGTYRLFPFSY